MSAGENRIIKRWPDFLKFGTRKPRGRTPATSNRDSLPKPFDKDSHLDLINKELREFADKEVSDSDAEDVVMYESIPAPTADVSMGENDTITPTTTIIVSKDTCTSMDVDHCYQDENVVPANIASDENQQGQKRSSNQDENTLPESPIGMSDFDSQEITGWWTPTPELSSLGDASSIEDDVSILSQSDLDVEEGWPVDTKKRKIKIHEDSNCIASGN